MTGRQKLSLAVTVVGAVLLAIGVGYYWYVGSSGGRVSLAYRDSAMVVLGAEVYAAHCAACHGASLEGQANWRERGADGRLPAPPHDETGHTWHHGDQQLFELTKYGPAALVGGDYKSDMPAYDGLLSDREILASLAFIKSTWPASIQQRHDEINQRAAD